MSERIGSLFSGVGGLDMAVAEHYGATVAWHAENEAAPAAVLAYRFPDVPNLGDVSLVDWRRVERVGIMCGGFPCQDVSLGGGRAGLKPATRSGLWAMFAEAIRVQRPHTVVIENVRGLLSAHAEGVGNADGVDTADGGLEQCPWCMGDADGQHALRALGAVLGGLAELGYDARWLGLEAAEAGAPHRRFRVFIVATDRARIGRGEGRPEPAWLGGRPDDLLGSAPDADAVGIESERRGVDGELARATGTSEGDRDQRERDGDASGYRGGAAASDTADSGRAWRSRTSRRGAQRGAAATRRREAAWGPYWTAIERWEHVVGREAPSPTRNDGRGGGARLNPELTEWMMGWPQGWVTDPAIGLSRSEQLKACGNGVVPQQAALALALIDRIGTPEAVAA